MKTKKETFQIGEHNLTTTKERIDNPIESLMEKCNLILTPQQFGDWKGLVVSPIKVEHYFKEWLKR